MHPHHLEASKTFYGNFEHRKSRFRSLSSRNYNTNYGFTSTILKRSTTKTMVTKSALAMCMNSTAHVNSSLRCFKGLVSGVAGVPENNAVCLLGECFDNAELTAEKLSSKVLPKSLLPHSLCSLLPPNRGGSANVYGKLLHIHLTVLIWLPLTHFCCIISSKGKSHPFFFG